MATERSTIYLKESDYARLSTLLENNSTAPAADLLDDELSRAELVDDANLPEDTVAMGCKVTFSDVNGKETTVTLVYPVDADVAQMKISVLTPVGSALIGLREGDSIDWPMPGGAIRSLRIVSVDAVEEE